MAKFKEVRPDQIVFRDVKIREVQSDDAKFADLCRSVAVMGVEQPIVVRYLIDENGRKVPDMYEGLDGCQRHAAATKTQRSTVPIKLLEDASDDDVAALQYVLNEHRIPTSQRDKLSHFLKYMFRHPHLTQREVADVFCVTENELSRILKLKNLTPEAWALVDAGSLKASAAHSLATIPTDYQNNYLEDACTMPVQEWIAKAKEQRQEIQKAAREGRDPKEVQIVPHLMKMADIKALWEAAQNQVKNSGPDDDQYEFKSGYLLAIETILQVDPETLARQKAEKERKLAEKKEEAAKKKAAEAQKVLDELAQRRATPAPVAESLA